MNELDALAGRIRERIPLTRHLEFRFGRFDGLTLTLCAPLAPNGNDKGTFFAGSQSTLVTLAGWSLTTLLAGHADDSVDVVAVDGQIRYTHPLRDEIRIEARVSDDAVVRFRERLERKGRAILSVDVQGCDPSAQTVCTFQGVYLARRFEHA